MRYCYFQAISNSCKWNVKRRVLLLDKNNTIYIKGLVLSVSGNVQLVSTKRGSNIKRSDTFNL